MSRRVLAVCLALLISLAVGLGGALEAAAATKKKKKAAPPAPAVEKPIYDAPMRVVIVQTSGKHCKEECPQWIAAEGEITPATPGQFAKVFKKLGKRKLPVLIRSPGGSISHAMEVGRMIRKRGLDVAVGFTLYEGCAPDQKSCKLPENQDGTYRGIALEYNAWCNSACHLVLAGGTRRLAGLGTYVGVHKPRTVWTREIVTYRERYKIVKGKKKVIDRKIVSRKPGKSKVTYGLYKGLRREVTAYYKEMGIDLGLIAENEKAEFKDINNLTKDQLDKYHLRTSAGGVAMLVGNEICKTTPKPGNCSKSAEGPRKQEAVVSPPELPMEMKPLLVTPNDSGCLPKCPVVIYAKGKITLATVRAFEDMFRRVRYLLPPVVLDSDGGDADAAMSLGRMLHKRGMDVASARMDISGCSVQAICQSAIEGYAIYVGEIGAKGKCAASCILVLAGGLSRMASPETELSFGPLASLKRSDGLPLMREEVLSYFKELEAKSELVALVETLAASQATLLDSRKLGATTLVNSTKPPSELFNKDHCRFAEHEVNCIAIK